MIYIYYIIIYIYYELLLLRYEFQMLNTLDRCYKYCGGEPDRDYMCVY